MNAPPTTRRLLIGEVTRLAWPAIVQGLLTTVVMCTDRLLLGRYGVEALGSMQISGPLLWSVFSVAGAFGAGTMAVVGRAVGAQDAERVAKTVRAVVRFAALVGLLLGFVGWFGRGAVADLLGGGAETSPLIRAMARDYMGVVFCVAPLQLLGVAAVTALQASGDTRTPMQVTGVAGVLNLGISWILIYGHFGAPELGVTGAALGTAASFALYAVILLPLLRRRFRASRSPARGGLAPVLRISGPAFLEKMLYHSGFLVYAGLIGRLGDTSMAAHQALIGIESLGFVAAEGFGIAAAALVAQKLGAGRTDQALQVGGLSALLGVAWLSSVGLLFLLIPERLVGLFSSDPQVIDLGAQCLRIAAIAQPMMALADVMAGALRGAGDTRTPMIVAGVGAVLVRIGGCALFAFVMGWGLWGIWIASTLDWAVRSVWLTVAFRRGRWQSLEL